MIVKMQKEIKNIGIYFKYLYFSSPSYYRGEAMPLMKAHNFR